MIPTFNGVNLTEYLIMFGVIFYSLYDCLAKNCWGDDATITYTIQKWLYIDPKVGVIAALIFGHIFLSTCYRLK